MGFLSFTGFLFGSFTSEFRWRSLASLYTPFSCPSFDVWVYFFYFLSCASASLLLFRLLCCSSSLPRFICCLFISFSWAMRLPFSFSSCSSGAFVFLPRWFLVSVPDFDPYFLVWYLRPCLLFLRFRFSFLYFQDFTVLLACVFLRYSAALSGPRLPHLFFSLLLGFLCCLCFSTVLSVSTPLPDFFLGCDGVWSLFVGLLRLLRFRLLLRLCFVFVAALSSAPLFVCSGSYYPLSFSVYRIPVFLYVFPWADDPAAPSHLPPCFYVFYGSGCSSRSSSAFPRAAAWLLLALCGMAPVALLVADFLGVVSHRSCFSLPGASPLTSCADFHRFLPFFLPHFGFLGCVFSLCVPSSSSLLEVFFAPASVPPQPV